MVAVSAPDLVVPVSDPADPVRAGAAGRRAFLANLGDDREARRAYFTALGKASQRGRVVLRPVEAAALADCLRILVAAFDRAGGGDEA
jgi:hypothetical protein